MTASRSVRFKISMLLVIPLISLIALWGFAATITVGDSLSLLNVRTLYEEIGNPGDKLVRSLQREHLLAAEYLATGSTEARELLDDQRRITDDDRQLMRRSSQTNQAQNAMSLAMKARYDDVMAAVDGIDDLRQDVNARRIDLVTLNQRFSWLPTAMQALINSMTATNNLELYQQSRSLTMIGFSIDHMSREFALAAGLLVVANRWEEPERRLFVQLATKREFLFEQGMAELEPELRVPFEQLIVSDVYRRFQRMEARLAAGTPGADITYQAWRQAAVDLEKIAREALDSGGVALASRGEPAAMATFARAGVAGVVGLAAVVLSVFVSFRSAAAISRELAALRSAAQELAEVRLPRVVARLRRGEKVDVAVEAPPLEPPGTTGEVRDVAAAFSVVQHTAVDVAVDQARLRESIGEALRNLARRSQGLLQRQLKLLDAMQRQTEDTEALEDLFRLDHLTTRMRRHAEGLIVLSGGTPGRTYRNPVPVADTLQGAVAEVEDYQRVRVYPMPDVAVQGAVVTDLIHLFAELIENATAYSPPHTEVSIRGESVAKGFAVEVEDRGLGMGEAEIEAINRRLAAPPEFNLSDTDRLGLVVVGRLATRHGVRVELRPSPFGGTTAIVLIPADVLAPEPVLEGAGA
ncbi:sensor histidine kinase [Acrocarpospora catenulata]|uniref:sensor histidine kinase n=1 Tax=Acrocarpospora catenulata TaxID=2836182 RepID=UPI001BDB138F|nr:nitrate- and nitrite sensing domain-containing protein [Acrocarpospora catenulata]